MVRINFFCFCLVAVFQFSSCSLVQQNVQGDSLAETNVSTPRPSPEKFATKMVDEILKKEWNSKYDTTISELERNHQLWQENKIENYNFEIGYVGGAMSGYAPVSIKVRKDKKISRGNFPNDLEAV